MIKLQYPYTSPSVTLDLQNPILGDSNQLQQGSKMKMTMSGALHTYRRTPISSKLLITFDNLKDADYTNLVSFIKGAAGQEIKYTDYAGSIWRVYHVSPVSEVTRNHRHSYTMELEGYLVP